MTTDISAPCRGFARLRLFLALSRTPHGLLDMATPALGALLALGRFPSAFVAALGLLTAFAGYTSVYALNDVVDYRSDLEKMKAARPAPAAAAASCGDLDAVFVRHPLAQGLLTLREGFGWTAAWGAVALLGAYALNPVSALVFVLGSLFEAAHCLLLRVTWLRSVLSGAVKTSGGVAAVFAVDPNPPVAFLVVFFVWLFIWEIGGQNVPNDWSDLEEDRRLGARTIPVRFGAEASARVILWADGATTLLGVMVMLLSPGPRAGLRAAGALAAGLALLVLPAWRLWGTRRREDAAILFNRASWYPAAMLAVMLAALLF